MDRQALRELWARNNDRPQFVRNYHDAFQEHLSDTTAGHLPDPDASTFAYRQFLNDYKGTVTRQLNDESPGSDPQDTEETEVEA
jgi:hypothetical protein